MELSSLGRYQIRGELGRGTMGVVYRGYDPVIDRPVALKTVLLPESYSAGERNAFLHRFFLEARIAGKLIHPNIVVTYDAASDEPTHTPFIAMELVEGEPLNHKIERQGRLEWRQAVEIIIPLALALEYAHQQHGIVHRDVKPANVLLTQRGHPKIADFGIAKLPKADLTQEGVVMGTPYYMSPEQVEGDRKLDGRSDLFSLGSVLYTMLVGRPPFEADELAAISHQVLYKNPVPPSETVPEIPAALDGVVGRALTKAAADRYPTGRAFAEDLRSVERGIPPRLALAPGERTKTQAPQTIIVSKPSAPANRRRGFGRLLVLVCLVVGALWFGALVDSDSLPEPLLGLSTWAGKHWESVRHDLKQSRAEQERLVLLQEEARSLLEKGEELEVQGHWLQVKEVYEESLRTSRGAEDGVGEASALMAWGRLEAKIGNWSKARADLDAAAAVHRIYANPAGEIEARILLGNLERDCGNTTRAEALYAEALHLAEKREDARLRGEVYLNQAILDLLKGRWESARETLLLAPAVGGEELSRQALSWLGVLSYASGKGGTSSWEEAGRICQDAGDSVCLAEVRLWEGRAAFLEGNRVRALSRFQEAERIFRQGPHLPGLAAAVESLAELALNSEDFATGEIKLEELADIRKRLGLSEWEPKPRVNTADPHWERLSFLLRALPRTALIEERLTHLDRAPSP